MPHHSEHPFWNMDMENWAKEVNLGATNKFPQGKLNAQDEGEIAFGIAEHEGKIILNFGKPISWIGLTKEEAKQIAHSLLEKSK